jgi:GDP-L-fucose synthase
MVSSACVYPREAAVPTPESEGFRGQPETSNEGYGWAKRMAEYQARAYGAEYGLKTAIARPYNCYGPRDHFDPEIAHVIPSLLRRVFSGEDPLRVWGDGTQSRSFLYVEDFARGLLDATERYAVGEPVNLGTSEEVTIARLVELVLEATGSKARVVYDRSKPAGQPRRNCDAALAREKLAFAPRVDLREGLRRTVEWIRATRALG